MSLSFHVLLSQNLWRVLQCFVDYVYLHFLSSQNILLTHRGSAALSSSMHCEYRTHGRLAIHYTAARSCAYELLLMTAGK
jgi:hypothetical protein